MWWEKGGSYSLLKQFESTEIKSVYLSFKTRQLSGLLFFKPAKDSETVSDSVAREVIVWRENICHLNG